MPRGGGISSQIRSDLQLPHSRVIWGIPHLQCYTFSDMKKWIVLVAISWFTFIMLPSIPAVRLLLASPLVVTDPDPRGDACYILAGADEFRERLLAAALLYNVGRVPKLIFMSDPSISSFNFVEKTHWSATQWALDILIHHGVPRDRIQVIERAHGKLGTLAEARNLKRFLPADVKRLVLVSSAPHMRRAMLAFGRVLPATVSLASYPATPFESSSEYYYPLWVEYAKLAVYAVVAR